MAQTAKKQKEPVKPEVIRTIPEYKKPYGDFQVQIKVGDFVTLHLRRLNLKIDDWELKKVEVRIVERYLNGFLYREIGHTKHRSAPWWMVHDFKIKDDPNGESE